MHVLVTAGNTLVAIDRVRCLTNIFTGRTGARIALAAHARGHTVTLLTSHPEVIATLCQSTAVPTDRWNVQSYQTFEDLRQLMEASIAQGRPDTVIHCAAVSDYLAGGIYAPAPATRFRPDAGHWESTGSALPALVDRAAGKVKSDEPELWLRLIRAPKLIDHIRTDWQFNGVLVKFKLEVGVSDEQLLGIAERSRRHSSADLMVANTLEDSERWAFVGPIADRYERVNRDQLASFLLAAVQRKHEEAARG
jgi:phosphopantothenoylcysteine synthetase/decarboxylase